MDKQVLLEKLSINNVEVSHRKHGDDYVTIVSHPLNVGEYKFEWEGPDGMTQGNVKIGQVLRINRCNFVQLNLPQTSVVPKIQYAVSTYTKSEDDVEWFNVDSSGPPFEWLVTVFFSKLLVKIITKIDSTEMDNSPPNDLDIYNNKEFSDVTVRCRNTNFECHKVFLATRSPVFKIMLDKNMKKKHMKNKIQIDDIKPEVMAELLQFIYTGKSSNNLDKFATDLFIAAEKYQIDSLKEHCQEKLISSINVANCISLLIMGDRYSPTIKKSALKFLVENKGSIKIEGRLKGYPSLMMEILNEMFGKGNDDDDCTNCCCCTYNNQSETECKIE